MLLDVVKTNVPVVDYAKTNGLNYKTTTNSIYYGKKLYNKYKRKTDPKITRIDVVQDRNSTIMGIQRVYDMYQAGVRGPNKRRMIKPTMVGKTVAKKTTVTSNRSATPLPYHFDTFNTVQDAWDNISSRIKDGEDMSLLIKFYNTVVKEANTINSNTL